MTATTICRDHTININNNINHENSINADMDMDMISPSPTMSAHSPTPLHEPWGLNSYFALEQQQQLDYINYNKSFGEDEGEDQVKSDHQAPSLAPILTSSLSHPSSSSSSATAITTAQLNPLDLKNTLLTGESIEVIDSGSSFVSSSSSSSPRTTEFDRQQLDDPKGIMGRSLPDSEKRKIMARLFSRAASNGDRARMRDMLEHFRDMIDLDAQDEDGTSPLIYAACFGHVEIASMLLQAGAVVDARDKFGWTALVWATNNKHDNMVRLLLEQGASTSATTAKGHTLVDFLRHDPNDNSKIVQIFQEPCRRDSKDWDCSPNKGFATGFYHNIHNNNSTDSFFASPGIEKQEDLSSTSAIAVNKYEQRTRTSSEGAKHIAFSVSMASLRKADQLDDDGDFDWDRCLPDQMFVFSPKDISHLIDATVLSMEPTRARPYKPVPAYVLFLAARFAHYYSTSGLLDELLNAAFSAIAAVTQSRPEDMTLTAYWISNASALLCFLRRDTGLAGASKVHRVRLEKLVEEMVQMFILDAERRIEDIVEPAMLDHDTIAGLDEVKFQSDWAFWRGSSNSSNNNTNNTNKSTNNNSNNKRASFPLSAIPTLYPRPLKRSSSQSSVQVPNRPSSPRQRQISPRTITTMLSSLLFVMQNYDIHPDTIQYVISQLLRYISFEIFNRMITNRRLLSRTKALQTRLNLSILEDWVRSNRLSREEASEQCKPLVQLLQLLQVLSLQGDIETWTETLKNLDILTPIQLRRVVNTYRFEVSEPRIPSPIKQHVVQAAMKTEKLIKQQSLEKKQLQLLHQQQLQQQRSSQRSSTESSLTDCSSTSRQESNSVSVSSRSSSPVAKLIISNMFMNRIPNPEEESDYYYSDYSSDDESGCRHKANLTGSSLVHRPLLTSEAKEAERLLVLQQQREQDEREMEELLSETKNSRSWIPFLIPSNLALRDGGAERVFVPLIPEEMVSLLDTYTYPY
ncbi:hypothetical protein BGZ83_010932 [Gryganskiella cystojenkinii]|nr:hypothetical protein BGZ83_010932 [Gryganskiella cystojenkinii]